MALNAAHRVSVICSLLPKKSNRMMDIGCGPITAEYPYADRAARITCIDWKLRVFGSPPANIDFQEGDFTDLEVPTNFYDVIVAADVFEHILVEKESSFVNKCIETLRPGGHMIISVPHKGTFAYLDPYQIKPAIHRQLWRCGLYKSVHNGSCDVRKGHKHYVVQELVEKFKPLQLLEVAYYGYFFDPLLSWADALSKRGGRFPGYNWLEQAYRKELGRDYGPRSFNVALKFHKHAI